jgi:hypothetical protein
VKTRCLVLAAVVPGTLYAEITTKVTMDSIIDDFGVAKKRASKF